MNKKNPKIKIINNGPYKVTGGLPMKKDIMICGKDGIPYEWKEGESYPKKEDYLLCRCGHSKKKPYCDQTHYSVNFDGTETAKKDKYLDEAELLEGPELELTDNKKLCAGARFCDRGEGTWKLTLDSDDPQAKKMAIEEACDCPSGRLVVRDKKTRFGSESRRAGKVIEPEFEKSIGIVEDLGRNVSGPIRAKGGVPVESSDGKEYEVRNRVTLCRCGKSENKPFCDGTHIEIGFRDENDK